MSETNVVEAVVVEVPAVEVPAVAVSYPEARRLQVDGLSKTLNSALANFWAIAGVPGLYVYGRQLKKGEKPETGVVATSKGVATIFQRQLAVEEAITSSLRVIAD